MQTQVYSQCGEEAFADQCVMHVGLQGGEGLAMFKAGFNRAVPRGNWKVKLDLVNKGRSVLNAPLILDSSMHLYETKAASIETPALQVGDVVAAQVEVIEGDDAADDPGAGLFAALLVAG